jgi:hypothetical protein
MLFNMPSQGFHPPLSSESCVPEDAAFGRQLPVRPRNRVLDMLLLVKNAVPLANQTDRCDSAVCLQSSPDAPSCISAKCTSHACAIRRLVHHPTVTLRGACVLPASLHRPLRPYDRWCAVAANRSLLPQGQVLAECDNRLRPLQARLAGLHFVRCSASSFSPASHLETFTPGS